MRLQLGTSSLPEAMRGQVMSGCHGEVLRNGGEEVGAVMTLAYYARQGYVFTVVS